MTDTAGLRGTKRPKVAYLDALQLNRRHFYSMQLIVRRSPAAGRSLHESGSAGSRLSETLMGPAAGNFLDLRPTELRGKLPTVHEWLDERVDESPGGSPLSVWPFC